MPGSVLLAAGGSGGHLFPAEALAHALKEEGYRILLLTDERAGRFTGTFPADEIHVVPAATLTAKNPLALARTALRLWQGVRRSWRIIRRAGPCVAVGFGGYPTLAPLLAARQAGVACLIHEQNAVMGRANRFLSSRVETVAASLPFAGPGPHGGGKTVTVGNPVRPEVLRAAERPYEPPVAGGPFRLLVFGGSQGARFFSEAIPEAIGHLSGAQRRRLRVTQQVRPNDREGLVRFFEEQAVDSETAPFLDDMADRIAKAHLIVSRAGASTVAELAVIGRPALLVPFPGALDHDQAANAAALERAGGALAMRQEDLDGRKLGRLLASFMDDPNRLCAMAASARAAARPDATRLLAGLVIDIAGRHAQCRSKGEIS